MAGLRAARCSPSAPSRCSASTCSSASRASLPLNPTDVGGVPPALAFNTAVSFVTNTNWQNYGGESTMSHLTQMAGLTVQNFVSAAVGIAVAVALIRGLVRRRSRHDRQLLGRPDARRRLRVLLPLAIVVALAAREPGRRAERCAASTEAHDGRGRDAADLRRAGREPGGDQGARARTAAGSYNANSAHPFENPTGFTNLVEMLRDPADPVRAHVRVRAAGRRPAPGLGGVRGDVRALARLGRARDRLRGRRQPARSRRSAPTAATWRARRFASARPRPALFAATTTGTSTGAVNAAHDSFTPSAAPSRSST